jgi:tetratricopeptide (TPR) repeat protein
MSQTDLFGRASETARIREVLDEVCVSGSGPHIIVVDGESGVGKSAVVRLAASMMWDRTQDPHAIVALDFRGLGNVADIYDFAKALADGLEDVGVKSAGLAGLLQRISATYAVASTPDSALDAGDRSVSVDVAGAVTDWFSYALGSELDRVLLHGTGSPAASALGAAALVGKDMVPKLAVRVRSALESLVAIGSLSASDRDMLTDVRGHIERGLAKELSAWCGGGPVVLTLDTVERAARMVEWFLESVVGRIQNAPVLVLTAGIDGRSFGDRRGVHEDAGLACTYLPLRGLTSDGIASIIRSRFPAMRSTDVAALSKALHSATRGIAIDVLSTLREIDAHGVSPGDELRQLLKRGPLPRLMRTAHSLLDADSARGDASSLGPQLWSKMAIWPESADYDLLLSAMSEAEHLLFVRSADEPFMAGNRLHETVRTALRVALRDGPSYRRLREASANSLRELARLSEEELAVLSAAGLSWRSGPVSKDQTLALIQRAELDVELGCWETRSLLPALDYSLRHGSAQPQSTARTLTMAAEAVGIGQASGVEAELFRLLMVASAPELLVSRMRQSGYFSTGYDGVVAAMNGSLHRGRVLASAHEKFALLKGRLDQASEADLLAWKALVSLSEGAITEAESLSLAAVSRLSDVGLNDGRRVVPSQARSRVLRNRFQSIAQREGESSAWEDSTTLTELFGLLKFSGGLSREDIDLAREMAIKQGRLDEYGDVLEALVAASPRDRDVAFASNRDHSHRGRFLAAASAIRHVIEVDRLWIAGWNSFGIALFRAGEFQNASAAFRAAVRETATITRERLSEANMFHLSSLVGNCVHAMSVNGELVEAARLLEEHSSDLSPEDGEKARAMVDIYSGEPALAVERLRELVANPDLDAEMASFYSTHLALAESLSGNVERGIELAQARLDGFPGMPPEWPEMTVQIAFAASTAASVRPLARFMVERLRQSDSWPRDTAAHRILTALVQAEEVR